MTKTEILTDITTKFADESNITAEELREVVENIVNYLVPDVILVTSGTPSTIIQFLAGTTGNMIISKVGRLVTINGILINNSGSSSSVGFKIIDEDYKPDFPLGYTPFIGNCVYRDQSDNVYKPNRMFYTIDTVQTDVNIPTGGSNALSFSITYLTNS